MHQQVDHHDDQAAGDGDRPVAHGQVLAHAHKQRIPRGKADVGHNGAIGTDGADQQPQCRAQSFTQSNFPCIHNAL